MTRPYLWYSNSSCITGRALGNYLGIRYGKNPPRNASFIIGWGCKHDALLPSCEKGYINPPDKISINRNKFKTSKKLSDNGVFSPRVIKATSPKDIRSALIANTIKYPLIGRRISHQGGRDAILCLNMRDVKHAFDEGTQYFSEYIPNEKEYRIHIFKNQIIRIQKKGENEGTENSWIKSSHNGWVFCEINDFDTVNPELKTEAKKSLNIMGLDFGAVDVVWSDFKKPYVLEINTAPSLNEEGIEIYGEKIREFLNNLRVRRGLINSISNRVGSIRNRIRNLNR